MTNSKNDSQEARYEKWTKTKEADTLRQLEESVGLRLDGIAFFLANNSPTKQNG